MILGRVVGNLWACTKSSRLEKHRFLLVRPYGWYMPQHNTDLLVAVDQLGARLGQDVLVCLGQGGRTFAGDSRVPLEASVAALVDKVTLDDDFAQSSGLSFEGDKG